MKEKWIIEDTKDLWNEFMEIPRNLKLLGWKAVIPSVPIIVLVIMVYYAIKNS